MNNKNLQEKISEFEKRAYDLDITIKYTFKKNGDIYYFEIHDPNDNEIAYFYPCKDDHFEHEVYFITKNIDDGSYNIKVIELIVDMYNAFVDDK